MNEALRSISQLKGVFGAAPERAIHFLDEPTTRVEKD